MLKMLRHLRSYIYAEINIMLFFFYINPPKLSVLNNSLLYVEEQTAFISSQYIPFKRSWYLIMRLSQ